MAHSSCDGLNRLFFFLAKKFNLFEGWMIIFGFVAQSKRPAVSAWKQTMLVCANQGVDWTANNLDNSLVLPQQWIVNIICWHENRHWVVWVVILLLSCSRVKSSKINWFAWLEFFVTLIKNTLACSIAAFWAFWVSLMAELHCLRKLLVFLASLLHDFWDDAFLICARY